MDGLHSPVSTPPLYTLSVFKELYYFGELCIFLHGLSEVWTLLSHSRAMTPEQSTSADASCDRYFLTIDLSSRYN